MATTTITIPNNYGWVILTAASTMILNQLHGMNTVHFRKLSKVSYPAAYATPEQEKADKNAYLLNCAQRAHANFTENHTTTLATLLITGLEYPIAASVLGAIWTVGRYVYMKGYCNPAWGEKGRGRYKGAVHYIGALGLLGLFVWQGAGLLLKK